MAMHIARTSKPKKNGAGMRRSWPDARLKILDEMGIEFPEDCKKLASYFLGKGKARLEAAEAKVKLEREEEERQRQQER
ncbi:hypothetical protein AAVH_25966 [Aphelenchoides avenae]|nr:hypothetical protein AAVH_25966 [Aphelenchus avenae]